MARDDPMFIASPPDTAADFASSTSTRFAPLDPILLYGAVQMYSMDPIQAGRHISHRSVWFRPRHRRRMVLSILFAAAVFWTNGTAVQAQSFLEQLEKAVKSQLQTPDSTAQPPGAEPESGPTSAASPSPTESTGTADELPPPAPAPIDGRGPANKPKATGQIYLGVEVEAPRDNRLGVTVTDVVRGGPAWKAGLRAGDRILAINGYAIGDMKDMVAQLAKLRPGDSVRFLVNRDGTNREMTAVLMDAGLAGAMGQGSKSAAEDEEAWLGVTTVDLTDAFRQRFGIGVFRGAAVTSVDAGSPAKLAGLRPGDTIVEVDGTPIETAADLATWLHSANPGRKIELLIYRGAFPHRIELTLA
ncbi:MAG: PDZ domain-containing protein, partial [Planctomycetota bacterium]